MAPANLTRRRMIAIAAATAGSAFLSGGRVAWAGEAVRWRGSALGAQVSIDIFHPDREEAERIVQVCLLEVRRLERQFSLYLADSAICALNRSVMPSSHCRTWGPAKKSSATMAQLAMPNCRETGGFGRSHSLSFDHRFRPDTLRTAMATAFFCPTSTTNFLPRVTPV